MTESEFQRNMAGGKTLASISDYPDTEYWAGYQRGCRRNYHGDTFGTDDEHTLWMALADNHMDDDTRRFRGIGYRAGFDGLPISEAIKHLQQVVARSMAGSALGSRTSEKKAAAARANASKPRSRKFWMVRNKVGALNRSVIAISESVEGEKKAREAGYERVSLNEMTEAERKCLRDYDQNNPTVFPAQYLG